MEIIVKRTVLNNEYTEGKLSIVGNSFTCDTLEDTNRDINKNGKFDGNEVKIHGKTAIPFGRYKVVLDIVSPKFSKVATYNSIQGKLPRLLNVPHFEGILIHIGNTVADTDGCLLVGVKLYDGFITKSKDTFFRLYDILKQAEQRSEEI